MHRHNTSKIFINFTYPNSEKDVTVKFWTLYDITIFVSHCDVSCRSCYGALNIQCFSCSDTYFYVDNNTCLASCAAGTFKVLNPSNTATGSCVSSCPIGYYTSGSDCLACSSGCLSCTSATSCTVSSTIDSESLWNKFIVLWIILIVLAVFLIIAVVWWLLTPSSATH